LGAARYTATIDLLNGTQVPYYLDEEHKWGLAVPELERSLAASRAAGKDVRALVVINPGNPTGAMMSEANIREVIRFAHARRLVLLVDEVYQVNCYDAAQPFVSFRQVLASMPAEVATTQELFSFHSVSKGVVGECGRRGGFMALTNIDAGVHEQLVKRASLSLCSNLPGQVLVDLMLNPPREGDASYPLYHQEHTAIFESLKRRGQKLSATLNTLEGVFCHPTVSSMYAFPAITLSPAAVAAAAAKGVPADEFYCAELLEQTGVVRCKVCVCVCGGGRPARVAELTPCACWQCVVPGSGFLQRDGTYHFRTTFLPQEDQMDQFLTSIKVGRSCGLEGLP
jgi:aspartate/methionine/tyrosine aminotransferase